MTAPSHLKSLQAIEMALRSGSLAKAADALSITPAAVGQRIKALEDYLGLELIVRGRSGLRPTPALSEAVLHLHAAFRELEIFSDRMDVQRGEEIHIAAPSDFAELWLTPRLGRFRAKHPKVLFCINGEGDVPFRVGRVDCSIGFGRAPETGNADMLFRDFLLPVSSPENAARIQAREPQERLEGFPLLHLDLYKDDPAAIGWKQWIAAVGLQRNAPERGIRFRRMTHALDAVLSNAGLLICGLALISDLIDENRLALPYPASSGRWTDHAYQARFNLAHVRPQVARFRRWMVEESGSTEAWIEKIASR
jgi:LysR family transcriptional regulator, glycine cleavage system transcriptional activator